MYTLVIFVRNKAGMIGLGQDCREPETEDEI
jgi:hypothetical protein